MTPDTTALIQRLDAAASNPPKSVPLLRMGQRLRRAYLLARLLKIRARLWARETLPVRR